MIAFAVTQLASEDPADENRVAENDRLHEDMRKRTMVARNGSASRPLSIEPHATNAMSAVAAGTTRKNRMFGTESQPSAMRSKPSGVHMLTIAMKTSSLGATGRVPSGFCATQSASCPVSSMSPRLSAFE
jgi:hypothetical protein